MHRPIAAPRNPDCLVDRWDVVQGLRTRTRTSICPVPGANPAVVLVHGLGVSSRYMVPTAEHIAPDARVFAPDLPGFGRSARPAEAFGVGRLAAFLDAWMDAVGLERAVWLGNSFGCQLIVELALRHPARIERAVLQGITPDVVHRSRPRHVARLAADAFLEPPSLVYVAARDYFRAGVRRCWTTFRYLMEDPIEQKLSRLAAPALVVRGEWDPIVSQEWSERAAALLPDARLAVVPGAAHAVNYSHPSVLAALVRTFAALGQD